MNDLNPDFIAILKYRTAEEGGRDKPAFSGYRPHIKFPFSNYLTSGQQKFIDKEIVYPGDTVKAAIVILATDVFANTLEVGMPFEFAEGSRIIGTGEIIEIVNENLRKE